MFLWCVWIGWGGESKYYENKNSFIEDIWNILTNSIKKNDVSIIASIKMNNNSKTESVVDKNIIIIYKDNDKTYLDISLTEIRILPVNMTF